jgi:hypothetical protein
MNRLSSYVSVLKKSLCAKADFNAGAVALGGKLTGTAYTYS